MPMGFLRVNIGVWILGICGSFIYPSTEGIAQLARKSPEPKPVIRVALVDTGFPPFYFTEKSKREGIYERILAEVSKVSDLKFSFHRVSQKRKYRDFGRRRVDMEPGVNPAIRKAWSDISVYSKPFAEVADVVVTHALDDKWTYLEPKDMIGRTLGCMAGYKYPEFEEYFAAKTVRREDSPKEELMLMKLTKKRIDSGIVFGPVARFLMRENKGLKVRIAGTLTTRPMQFRIHRVLEDLVPELDKAIEILKANGKIEEIFTSFR